MRAQGLGLLLCGWICACAAHDGAVASSESPATAAATNGNVTSEVAKMVTGALVSSSNDVLLAPRVHLVTFGNDANVQALESTLSALATSELWATQTAEYGVGALTLVPTVTDTMTWAAQVTSGLPTASPNSDVEAYLLAKIGGNAPVFGSVGVNDLFVLVMPPGVAASPNAAAAPACAGNVMAWHSAVSLPPSGLGIPYIVVPSCPGQSGLSSEASQSIALVQTLVAAATNPRQAGYGSLGPAFAGWWLAAEAPEAPHLCAAAQMGDPNFVALVDDMPYPIAPTWSNRAYNAGEVPCVPATSSLSYLTATPQLSETVALVLPGGSVPNMLGVLVAAGSSSEVNLVLGDGNTSAGLLNVAATELTTSDLTLSLSRSQGVAGDTLMLSIGLSAQPVASQYVVQLTVSSGATAFSQYLLVRQSAP